MYFGTYVRIWRFPPIEAHTLIISFQLDEKQRFFFSSGLTPSFSTSSKHHVQSGITDKRHSHFLISYYRLIFFNQISLDWYLTLCRGCNMKQVWTKNKRHLLCQ